MNSKKRSQFASKIGFLLATAGSAVGLGNLWKFPYMTGLNGGFIFMVVSLFCVFVIGMPIMMSEIAIGRNTQKSPVGAFSSIDKKYKIFGIIPTVVAFIILSYYSVIGGWILKYLFTYLTGGIGAVSAEAYYTSFISNPIEPILWHALFMAIVIGICYMGVNNGIERAGTIMMPALFVIVIIIGIRSVTLPGAKEGLSFLFKPNFDKITSPQLYIGALSQSFYSLSLGMAAMVTYGSYMKKNESIAKDSALVCSIDLSVAILASIAIMPAVFSAGLKPESGPSLIFVSLPHVFEAMPFGTLFAILFFVLVLFAAVTSAMSLLEATAAYTIDERNWTRPKAILIIGFLMIVLGIPSSLSMGVLSDWTIMGMGCLDFLSFFTDNIMLPISAFCMCIYVSRCWKTSNASDEIGLKGKLRTVYKWIISYIAPVAIAAIFIYGLLPYIGVK